MRDWSVETAAFAYRRFHRRLLPAAP